MRLHANARLSVKGRELLIERLRVGWSLTEAATAAGVSERTARKWRDRYQAEGTAGLVDRSSMPKSVPSRTPEDRIEVIAALRRLRLTGAEIAALLGMALSTVSGILARIGMGKLGPLGLEPPQRYERERPGLLIHIDVKKLGRIQGGAGKRISGVRRNASPRQPHVAAVQVDVVPPAEALIEAPCRSCSVPASPSKWALPTSALMPTSSWESGIAGTVALPRFRSRP